MNAVKCATGNDAVCKIIIDEIAIHQSIQISMTQEGTLKSAIHHVIQDWSWMCLYILVFSWWKWNTEENISYVTDPPCHCLKLHTEIILEATWENGGYLLKLMGDHYWVVILPDCTCVFIAVITILQLSVVWNGVSNFPCDCVAHLHITTRNVKTQ